MKITKEKAGLVLLLLIIGMNLIIAFNFYNLDKMPVGDFYYFQTNKGELFDPKKRY